MKASEAIEYLKKKDPDMPVFALLAQDALASETVESWAIRARAAGVKPDKVTEAFSCAEEMLQWPIRKMPD